MTEVSKTTIMKVRRVVEEHWLEMDSDEAQSVLADLVEDPGDGGDDAFDDDHDEDVEGFDDEDAAADDE
jgi:hypothetical protein